MVYAKVQSPPDKPGTTVQKEQAATHNETQSCRPLAKASTSRCACALSMPCLVCTCATQSACLSRQQSLSAELTPFLGNFHRIGAIRSFMAARPAHRASAKGPLFALLWSSLPRPLWPAIRQSRRPRFIRAPRAEAGGGYRARRRAPRNFCALKPNRVFRRWAAAS